MILYFSATGNSKYVASRVAQSADQEMLSIVDCMKNDMYDFSDKMIGIISPTYDWGLPNIVKQFLKKISFNTEYLFYVATYGTTPGASGAMARKAIKGRRIDAYYSVQMVDTWTPIFDISTPEKIAKYTKNTEKEIKSIINNIQMRYKNSRMLHSTPAFITKWIAEPIYNCKVRQTKNFSVEESCIGCGLCARKCPVQAIKMQNKKPVWIKDKCVMCLGCLHRCPKFAIQYGKKTKKHGQYTNPNVIV